MAISRLKMGSLTEISRLSLLKSAIAEFISTLLYTFLSRGSSLSFRKLNADGAQTPTSLLFSGISNSFAFSALAAASAKTSGGHVNPAVTLGLFVGGQVTLVRAALYVTAQLVGSIAGVLLVSVGAVREEGVWSVGVMEGVRSFGVVMAVRAVREKGGLGAMGIGFAVGVGGGFEGAVINPAVTFGEAVVGWDWEGRWVCWAAQFVGAGLAGFF